MRTGDNVIQFSDVTKRYANGHEALSHITFSIEPGEMVFLTGHSGAGKSTLLKLIAAIERPTLGEIVIQGKNINRLKKNCIAQLRRQIGLIFQTPYLLKNQNVFYNVALPLIIEGYQQKEIASRAHAALNQVGLLDKENALPETLSSGEQQRVGIARAIATKPPIILADEPTGNLDPQLSEDIMRLFERFNQIGITMLIATHNLSLIHRMQQRIITLDAGTLLNENEVI